MPTIYLVLAYPFDLRLNQRTAQILRKSMAKRFQHLYQ